MGRGRAGHADWQHKHALPRSAVDVRSPGFSSLPDSCLLDGAMILVTSCPRCAATLRLAAARLLRASLMYGEGEVLPQLPTVVHALRTAVADDDAGARTLVWRQANLDSTSPLCDANACRFCFCNKKPACLTCCVPSVAADVATQAVACVHVLGVNLPPRHWLPLAAELATAEQQSAAQRTAALVVLSALLYAASRSGVPVEESSLQLAAATLASPQVADAAAATDGEAARQQVLAACSNLLRSAGPAVVPAAPQLFALLLRLWAADAVAQQAAATVEQAMQHSSSNDSLSAAAVLEQLAAAVGTASASELCERYGLALLSGSMQVRAENEAVRGSQPVQKAFVSVCLCCVLSNGGLSLFC